uniref:FAD dependent oxidoreductase domain-containing protein n=1 Tax=Plectus sambesii TaxID=2011161 RepID=A0A914UZI7_9BILA
MTKIGVIGTGIAGCSSALAILKRFPAANLTLFSDKPFRESTSYGPAGLFRLDHVENRKWARATFEHFTELHRTIGGAAGIQLMSGHILSDNLELMKSQDACMRDIVFNFRWLEEREFTQFASPSKYAIHFTSYTTEGRTYVPWLVKNLEEKGAKFEVRKIASFDELGDDFDFVINCTGYGARALTGDTGLTP